MKIVLSGYYGHGNTGDEAILFSIAEQLKEHDLTVVSLDPGYTKKNQGLDSVNFYNIEETEDTIRKSDAVIMGGGGLFEEFPDIEYYETKISQFLDNPFGKPNGRLTAFAIVPLIAAVYKKPLIFLAHGIGPFTSESAKSFYGFILSISNLITVRDRHSLSWVEQLCSGKQTHLSADPAFLLKPSDSERLNEIVKKHGLTEKRFIALSLRDLLESALLERTVTGVAKTLNSFLSENDLKVLFIPFQDVEIGDYPTQDRKIALRLRDLLDASLQDRFILLDDRLHPQEILSLMGRALFGVGMRYHFLIFSIMNSVPVISLSYAEKCSSLMKEMGMDDLSVRLPDLEHGAVLSKMHVLLEAPNQYSEIIRKNRSDMVERASLSFSLLRGVQKAEGYPLQKENGSREGAVRCLIVYPFCTFGGVERVFLNRAGVFRKYNIDIEMDIVFLYDGGGLEAFKNYVEAFGLSECIKIYLSSGDIAGNFPFETYDLVFNIDTPSAFEQLSHISNLYVECHTPYKENRTYLKTLPEQVKAVLVPSQAFCDEIHSEVPDPNSIFVLPNSVPENFFNEDMRQRRGRTKRPIVYMARLDKLKNIAEAIEIFKALAVRDDLFFLIIGRGATDPEFLGELKKQGLFHKTVTKENVIFGRVPKFLKLLRAHRGIFLSPSKGESFGLAVAESIAVGVPVMVSDLPSHRQLVGGNENFLYSLGNIFEAEKKILHLLDDWDNASRIIRTYRDQLRDFAFVKAWGEFIASRTDIEHEKKIRIAMACNRVSRKENLSGQIALMRERLEKVREELYETRAGLFRVKKDFASYKQEKEQYIASMKKYLEQYKLGKEQYIHYLRGQEKELLSMKRSLTWKINQFYGRYLWGTKIHSVIEKIVNAVVPKAAYPVSDANQTYPMFSPYARLNYLKDIEVIELTDGNHLSDAVDRRFSLVTTVKNEEKNITEFLQSIANQSRVPGEVIVVDGGSTDQTVNLIKKFGGKTQINLKLLEHKGNISQGRNVGIAEAVNEIIVLTDAGCKLDANFCGNLQSAFAAYDDVDLVSGIYHALSPSEFSKYFIYDWNDFDGKNFLPSARAVAIRKSLASEIGGFPEYLTLTGEDTLFDINYRRRSRKWVINKRAFVYWDAPKTKKEALALAFRYGQGDGESGMGDFRFYRCLGESMAGRSIPGDFIEVETFKGYLEGRKKRADIEMNKRNLAGIVFLLSGPSFADSGGNHRATQRALDFIGKNYKVIYIASDPPEENFNRYFFDIDYTLLELYQVDDFDIREFIDRYGKFLEKISVMVMSRNPAFGTLIQKISEKSGVTIGYDFE